MRLEPWEWKGRFYNNLSLSFPSHDTGGRGRHGGGGRGGYGGLETDLRQVLPEANLDNNTVTEVYFNVGEVALLPCHFPQLSTLHQVRETRARAENKGRCREQEQGKVQGKGSG